MTIHIELGEEDLKKLVIEEIERRLGEITFDIKNVRIEVKSKQNYRSEWEPADFRAVFDAF